MRILFNFPEFELPEHGSYCLRQLFSSFRLRGYYDATEESECLDEYVTFEDSLRQQYPGISQPSLLIADTVDFLMGQESLQTRPLLHKLFRLRCLCLDVPFLQLPGIKLWNVDSEDPTSRLVDLVQPVQSYYANVARGVEVTTSDDCFEVPCTLVQALSGNFGNIALSDVYCPWLSVDFFDCAKIHKSLDPTGSCPRDLRSPIKIRETAPIDSPKTIYFQRGKKRGR